MTIAFPLERFVEAQAQSYDGALAEIRRGAKRSHWMWFIFPQLAGLGHSEMAKFYGMSSLDEAQAYLKHPVLGARYFECVGALQDLRTSNPVEVFGDIDAMKLRSSLTLFQAAQPMMLFGAAIDRWFAGVEDGETLRLLGQKR
ncbi:MULTISPECIES: DUF1810 domain-containing protein [Sphingomonas]|jgi:uncharacterized protein (DUF1810 family)|uniref:Calpastatin n=1 Tax=Sphingomonas turrisvirgatae TaxID=1888892 RepID=A0A1E3LYP1_9SPHN|nr:DUF1810 domain-containing protein [Sphingomonas turrisvirgatae]ODP38916.1 calpastatin [Sphingomonas turrisvirgatae]